LLELRGENPFKCRAYHTASRILATLTEDLKLLISTDRLTKIKGIGGGLAEKIIELVETGKLLYHDDLKKSLPSGLIEMLRIPGLGPKRVKILYERLKIKTVSELKEAAEKHKLLNIEGFGEKSEENILRGIELLRKHAEKHLYSDAKEAADRILKRITEEKSVIRSDIAGSLRRRNEVVGDIDILASVRKGSAESLMEIFTSHPDVEQVIAKGETKASVTLVSGLNCDLRVIQDSEYPFALNYFTGSKEHNVQMRSLAKDHGWSLNEYGFSELGSEEKRGKAKQAVKCRDEEDIYRALGMQYIPPELRENLGEFEAALAGKLPRLIEDRELKGTFHCHTTYSDGLNSLEEMVEAAKAMGWEYLGIADHSKAAAYANGLSAERVKQQNREIDKLNDRQGSFYIFKGTESDILTDGTLDWSESMLGSFDYVVASIHSRFNMTEAEATKRIIKAIKNKNVTMLGHPTGRLLLQREGYPVDLVEVINAAADYGKIIEINSHPSRLDLDWRMCRYAKEKKVKLCINPDAHATLGLKDVYYGVGTARKGWLEKSDVVNTLPLKDIHRLFGRS